MLIRVRENGAVMLESEWRRWLLANGGPSFDVVTPEILDELGADAVFEGPQATGGDFWQYSIPDGVEQGADGKWYTKYVLGPVFVDYTDSNGVTHTAAEQQAAYVAEKTVERNQNLQDSIVRSTQARLDSFAQTRGYDGILSACTYATSPTAKFAAEGQYCVAQRDATWAKLYDMLAEVQAGTRPPPSSYADVEPELPELTWPI